MSDTSELSTELDTTDVSGESQQPESFQFSIKSLMAVTAVIAVFFALITQVEPFIPALVSFSLVHTLLLILSLLYPSRRNGFAAINYSMFNIFLLPVAALSIFDAVIGFYLWTMSTLGIFWFAPRLLSNPIRFNRISGWICIVI